MQNNPYRIISIDPGYDRCGVAIIDVENNQGTLLHSVCLTTKKTDLQEKRIFSIYSEINALIEIWHPSAMALETLFFSVNKKSAIKVAEARGIVVLLAGIHNLNLVELSPQAVKLAMTGIGNSDKKMVQKMVSLTLKIDTSNKIDDEIDAIALGFAAIGEIRMQKIA